MQSAYINTFNFFQGVLRIGVPEGGSGGDASPGIISHQIRAYWKCYETVRTRPKSDIGKDGK